MAAQLEEVEYTQAQARSMKEVDDAVKESSDEEALSAKKQVINQMKELTDKYKKLDTSPVESNNIKFYPSKVHLPQFSNLIEGDLTNSKILYSSGYTREGGQPQFKIITKDVKGQSRSLGGSQVSVEVKWSTGEVSVPTCPVFAGPVTYSIDNMTYKLCMKLRACFSASPYMYII